VPNYGLPNWPEALITRPVETAKKKRQSNLGTELCPALLDYTD